MKQRWPLFAGLCAFGVVAVYTLLKVLSTLRGEFAYALDDPYIHMATAKNLAFHGTWGVSADEFSSATSSLLWPLLLAGVFKLMGTQDVAALALNMCLAGASVYLAWSLIRERVAAAWSQAALLVLFVAATPLVLLCFIGMEHTLHIALALLFLKLLGAPEGKRTAIWLLVCAFLLTATRFEAGFMVFAAAVCMPKRWKLGLGMLAVCTLPVIIYGLISIKNGAMFLPNSVVLKGNGTHISSAGDVLTLILRPFWEIANTKIGLVCLLTSGAATFAVTGRDRTIAGTVFGTTYLHLMFAMQGWLFRYEAYLVAMTIAISLPIVLTLKGWPQMELRERISKAAGVAFLVILSLLLASRILKAQSVAVTACRNIHDQQVQMGRFVKANYNGKRVALNDIGAVSYYADIHCVDLVGLANVQIARAKKAGTFGTSTIADVTSHPPVDLTICYPEIFSAEEQRPDAWVGVGVLSITGNEVCWKPEVTFFAPTLAQVDPLRKALEEFAAGLPTGDELRF